jgi:uncharacterized protein (UPF0262 family)
MSDARIIKVELDEATILRRNADIEQERRVAIFDLIEDNVFKPLRDFGDGYAGPYQLHLSVEEGRLIWDIRREDGSPFEIISPFATAITRRSARRALPKSRPSTWRGAVFTTKPPRS